MSFYFCVEILQLIDFDDINLEAYGLIGGIVAVCATKRVIDVNQRPVAR